MKSLIQAYGGAVVEGAGDQAELHTLHRAADIFRAERSRDVDANVAGCKRSRATASSKPARAAASPPAV